MGLKRTRRRDAAARRIGNACQRAPAASMGSSDAFGRVPIVACAREIDSFGDGGMAERSKVVLKRVSGHFKGRIKFGKSSPSAVPGANARLFHFPLLEARGPFRLHAQLQAQATRRYRTEQNSVVLILLHAVSIHR
jgi:hypothetical protein